MSKLSRCGADCSVCPVAIENDCPGCGNGKMFEDEECEVLSCCTQKGCENCGYCPQFPCAALKTVSLDEEEEIRLMRLKAVHDRIYRKRRRRGFSLLSGLLAGLASGVAIGGFSGQMGTWIFTGTLIGGALGAIFGISGKEDNDE